MRGADARSGHSFDSGARRHAAEVVARLRRWVRAVTHLALQAPAEVVGGKALILDTATGNGHQL